MSEPDRILRIRTVLHRTGLSRSTLYRKINDGSFPRQLRIGEHSAGWRESAVNHWMADPASYRADVIGRGALDDADRLRASALAITPPQQRRTDPFKAGAPGSAPG